MVRKAIASLALLGASSLAAAATCPTLVGQWSAGPADAVAAAGSYAYFSSGANFVVADIGNPASPTVIGSLALPGPANRIVLSGSVAYVAMGDAGLAVIDVTDPTHPAQVGQLAGPAYDVAASGTNVFVAAGELLVFDASNPAALAQVGSLSVPYYNAAGYTSVVTGATNVVMASAPIAEGPYGPTGWVDVVLVTDPSHPAIVGRLGEAVGNGYGGSWNVTAAGTLALVSDSWLGNDWLEVWDVSRPSTPVQVGIYGTEGYSNVGVGQARDRVAAAGGLVFLGQSSPGPQQLGGLSISDPPRPTLTASAALPAIPSAVAVSGTHVFVADG
jgi:hypothetical protein